MRLRASVLLLPPPNRKRLVPVFVNPFGGRKPAEPGVHVGGGGGGGGGSGGLGTETPHSATPTQEGRPLPSPQGGGERAVGDGHLHEGEAAASGPSSPDEKDADQSWPDLVLVDGGEGQLRAARETLAGLGIVDVPLVGIAKGPDRDAGRETFYMA